MWILVQRLSLILFTALSVDQVLRIFSSRGIKKDTIYNTDEVAALLSLKKGVILELIKNGDIKARRVNGKYLILGQNIQKFLSE